jgi:TRAP-type mannitol/chloroaromatic compound transport system substrate-binding protein
LLNLPELRIKEENVFRGKKIKSLIVVSVVLTIVLSLTLIASACATTTPTSTPSTTAKQINITMEANCPAGWFVVAADYYKKNIEAATDGRITVEIILGEAIVPTAEQLDALRDGTFDLLFGYTAYYKTKIPFIEVQDFLAYTLRDGKDIWALYNKRGWGEIADKEYAKYNVKRVCTYASTPDDTLFSTKPVNKWEDLKGMKVRGAGTTAEVIAEAGAATVWFPGEEIYTGLASGLVDAATYSSPATGYSFGWQEVAKYWIRPSIASCQAMEMLANMDFWNSLSADDQVLIANISETGGWYAAYFLEQYDSLVALEKVQKENGVTVIYWDADSLAKMSAAGLKILPEWTDPAANQAKQILLDYMKFLGYTK